MIGTNERIQRVEMMDGSKAGAIPKRIGSWELFGDGRRSGDWNAADVAHGLEGQNRFFSFTLFSRYSDGRERERE